MKKSYLTLAAMAMIMASCSNEVLIDNESGQTDVAIGFSTFSDLATKGDNTVKTNLEYYHGTFSVYGSKKSTVDQAISHIFAADKITYSDGATTPNDWTYSPYRYWDKQANYNFIAVAPSSEIVEYSIATGKEVGDAANDFVTVSGGYTLKGQNLQATATAGEKVKGFTGIAPSTDTDIMVSVNNAQVGASHDSEVKLLFHHILAKLNVTVAKDAVLNNAVVTVDSIKISGLDNKGTYSENSYKAPFEKATGTYVSGTTYYNDEFGKTLTDVSSFDASTDVSNLYVAKTKASGWSSLSAVKVGGKNYTLNYAAATGATDNVLADATSATVVVPTYFIESLVMPQAVAAEKVTMKYTIVTKDAQNNEHKENFTYQMDLKDAFANGFFDRCNYTLKFTIKPDVIKFDATAVVWDEQDAVNITIQ